MHLVGFTVEKSDTISLFFKEIYCTGSIYRAYKDKLQNSTSSQFE